MRKQSYGRIINTSSVAGLYGSEGLVDYSTAKSGLNGFTQSLAIEGSKRNIYTNSICPMADTRMLRMTKFKGKELDFVPASLVVPMVAVLCHESCKANGGIFEAGGGFCAKIRWQRAEVWID